MMTDEAPRRGPPPLRPFGLVLHRDASWTHEGVPIRNKKLRARFDRAVRYLPEEGKYVVQIGHFRGEIEIEEVGFFVRRIDFESGEITLSDECREPLDLTSLRPSGDGEALLCTVKRELAPEGLPALFTHAAQAELLLAVEEADDALFLVLARERHRLPAL